MKRILLFILTLILLLGTVSAIQISPINIKTPTTEYTASTSTTCIGTICTKSLYSGTKFVYEDNKWKDVKDARSLMSIYTIKHLKDDGVHDLELIAVNYTSVRFKAILKDSKELNKDIPFKINDNIATSTSLKTLDEQKFILVTATNVLENNYTFGAQSTTISLQDANTENHEDASVLVGAADTPQGGDTQLMIITTTNHRAFYIKWGITSIPAGVTIIDVKARIRNTRMDEAFLVGAYHVYTNNTHGKNWSEDTLTWNNQPCGVPFLSNNAKCNITPEQIVNIDTVDTFFDWNVTPSLKQTYAQGQDNYSLFWVTNSTLGPGNSNYQASKEHATADYRPQLNITYELNLPSISFEFYPLNSSGEVFGDVNTFNSSSLVPIEKMRINITVTGISETGGLNYSLWFAINGTNACALGNKQSKACIIAPTFIEFRNETNTTDFNSIDSSTQGDSISCTDDGGVTTRVYTCDIDEHYQSVFKWYDAQFNFSSTKWQDGADQRITRDNYIKILVNDTLIPPDADFYKLDFRVNYTSNPPTDSLDAYACSVDYTTGEPAGNPDCALIASKMPSELQDDGTKFRAIFPNDFLPQLGDIKFIVLKTDELAPSKYYILKTYKARTTPYVTKWEFSTDAGTSFANLGDGFETELNGNWFNDDDNSTHTLFKFQFEDGSGTITNSSINAVKWNIDAAFNLAPIIDMIAPVINQSISGIFNITWTAQDPNNFTINISMFNGSTNDIVTGLAKGTTHYLFDTSTFIPMRYNMTVTALENDTVQRFFSTDTHEIAIIPPPSVDNNISTFSLVLLNGTHKNISITFVDSFNASFLSINGTVNFTRNGVEILNNSFQNLSAGVHTFQAIIVSNSSVNGSSSLLIATVQNKLAIPQVIEFKYGVCRLDDTATVLMMFLFFMVALAIILLGKILPNGLVGALGSFMLVFLSFYLYFCIFLPAIMLTMIGFALMFYFVHNGMNEKL